jgi:hypothetical protein
MKNKMDTSDKYWVVTSNIGSFFLVIAIITLFIIFNSRDDKQDYKYLFMAFVLLLFVGVGNFTIWRLNKYILGSNIVLIPYYVLISYLLYLLIFIKIFGQNKIMPTQSIPVNLRSNKITPISDSIKIEEIEISEI